MKALFAPSEISANTDATLSFRGVTSRHPEGFSPNDLRAALSFRV